MPLNLAVNWHKKSFEIFVHERLPQAIEERLPLTGYRVEEEDRYAFSLKLTLTFEQEKVEVDYDALPQPDAEGIFRIDDHYRVVVPYPSHRELEEAEIFCVGEQLDQFIRTRLGEAPENVAWDAEAVKTWMPIDAWMREFHTGITSQYLQMTNWLDRYTHLRRLSLIPIAPEPLDPGEPDDETVFPHRQLGLVCPYCTPEGPNVGRLLEVARGAEIRAGKLVRIEDSPEGCLGFSASMVPFLEHDDTNRALMGINLMRQWMAPSDPELPIHERGWFGELHEKLRQAQGNQPEPALVQTGEEPEAPDFWGGYNLLTAFVMWDGGTFEDGIVISESCARRLDFPAPIEVGDRISNRHGAKGTVTQILPDAQMPQLPDGRTVELIYSPTSMISRLNFGQVREALMGRIANAEGKPAIVPPFQAPKEEELRRRLRKAGLPEDGMEQLMLEGEQLPHRSTVGWVYWGRLIHTARERLEVSVTPDGGQRIGALAFQALMESGAFASVREYFDTCSAEREDADTLARRLAADEIQPAPPPALRFERLRQLLEVAGIEARIEGERLKLDFAETDGLKMAMPIGHPWAPERELKGIGRFEELPAVTPVLDERYEEVRLTNDRLAQMVSSEAPEGLRKPALIQLEQRVAELFDNLLDAEHLRVGTRVLFSGHGSIVPGSDLRWDQVGVPEEMAWALFGPQVVRETGDEEAVEKRSATALTALDAIMERSWIVLYSAQEVLDDAGHAIYHAPLTALLAFHPVRRPEPAIFIHPRVCYLMEIDFDGDQATVLLPLTGEAQQEAGEKLSIAGHVRRNPDIFKYVTENFHGMLWGLARLNATKEGRDEIAEITDMEIREGLFDKQYLRNLLQRIFLRDGVEKALETFDRLTRRGYEVSRRSGASFNPFLGSGLEWPEMPEGTDMEEWRLYCEETVAAIFDQADYADDDLGPLALLNRSGARGSHHQLFLYLGAFFRLYHWRGKEIIIRHGYREGTTAEEALVKAPTALWGLAQANQEWMQMREEKEDDRGGDFHLLGRALRARQPGVVFARAAMRGEVDPLESVWSRLFVGLPIIEA